MRLALVVSAALAIVPVPAVLAASPAVAAPSVAFTELGTISYGKVPVTVSWPAAMTTGAAINGYRLQRRIDGGRWRSVTLPSKLARSVALRIRPWVVVEFRVRAVDTAGNRSAWARSAPAWLAKAQESAADVELSAGWSVVRDAKAYGGERATTAGVGETAGFTFVGSEAAWIAARRPNGGRANVYVDGTLAKQVDLSSATARPRSVVFRAAWSESGPHTIEIATTAEGLAVDVDAFLTSASPQTAVLVGAGDISRCDSDGDSLTAAVVAGIEGIVYTTGDNVYTHGTAEEFASCYDPTWGAFRERTRPAPGNHDYGTPGAAAYFNYFGANAGEVGRGWYAYEAGTWRVYALNSECARVGGCGVGSAQYEWLAADLVAEAHRCVLVYWHRPRFSSGPHGSSTQMAAIFELLYGAGAELVLTGHDHTYERFAPARPDGTADPARGVRQIVIGTGGAALYAFATSLSLTETRDNSTHGVLRLDLSPAAYAWEFVPAGSGTFTDRGSTACH